MICLLLLSDVLADSELLGVCAIFGCVFSSGSLCAPVGKPETERGVLS